MTTPRAITDYGGPFTDALPVDDPTTTQSASQGNRCFEDVAQMTRTTHKVWVKFPTSTGAPGAVTPSAGQSHFGTGFAELPTVAKTSTGTYTVTYPATWTDALGVVEAVSFLDSFGSVRSGTVVGHVQTTESANVITVYVFNTSNALSDLTNGTTIRVEAR